MEPDRFRLRCHGQRRLSRFLRQRQTNHRPRGCRHTPQHKSFPRRHTESAERRASSVERRALSTLDPRPSTLPSLQVAASWASPPGPRPFPPRAQLPTVLSTKLRSTALIIGAILPPRLFRERAPKSRDRRQHKQNETDKTAFATGPGRHHDFCRQCGNQFRGYP